MRRAPSITANLMGGLTTVGITGALIFAVLDIYNVDIALETAGLESSGEAFSAFEQALFPVVFMLIPTYLAIKAVVSSSIAQLIALADDMGAAAGEGRGFRLNLENLPGEVMGFARAVNLLLGRLDDVAERREAFAAEVAHELKGPLATLALELDRLEIPEAAKLKADVQKMGRLLDQLLTMAQLETRTLVPMPLDSIHLPDLASEIVAMMSPTAAFRGRDIVLHVEGDCTIQGRREALGSALKNIIENAVRVTPSGGKVTVLAGPESRIRVRDGGPGLSGADLARMSRPYARATHSDHGGAGLGLAIASRVMTLHGGVLETNPQERELCLNFPLPTGTPLASKVDQ